MGEKNVRNVADDKGSFTVEASIISVFVVIIVVNLIQLIFYIHDYCIINELINRDILRVSNYIEKEELGYKRDISSDIEIKNIISCTTKEYNLGLLYIDVENILYTIENEKVRVEVEYNFKEFLFTYIYGKDKMCNFIRTYNWFDIKSNVRIN